MVIIAAAAARGDPLYRLRPGNGPRSADHATVEPPPRQYTKSLLLAELLELGLELGTLEQARRFGTGGDARHGDDGKLWELGGGISHRIDGHLDLAFDDGFVLLRWIGNQGGVWMNGDRQIGRTLFELGSEHTRCPMACVALGHLVGEPQLARSRGVRPDRRQPCDSKNCPERTSHAPAPAQHAPAQHAPAQHASAACPDPACPGPACPGPACPGPACPGPACPGPACPGPAC